MISGKLFYRSGLSFLVCEMQIITVPISNFVMTIKPDTGYNVTCEYELLLSTSLAAAVAPSFRWVFILFFPCVLS